VAAGIVVIAVETVRARSFRVVSEAHFALRFPNSDPVRAVPPFHD